MAFLEQTFRDRPWARQFFLKLFQVKAHVGPPKVDVTLAGGHRQQQPSQHCVVVTRNWQPTAEDLV